jgi:hypothetical protein
VVWGTNTLSGFSVVWGTSTSSATSVVWGTASTLNQAQNVDVNGEQ